MAGETRVCHTGRSPASPVRFPHFGEEDCLRGWNGSGTIFFACATCAASFCQNWDISQKAAGAECPPERLAGLMLALQGRGCHNINFVTPEHVVPQVLEALAARRRRADCGCRSSTTPAPTTRSRSLKLLDGIVDIYMPDFKFWEPETAQRLAEGAGLSGAGAARRSGRCTGRSACCGSAPTGWRGAACWCGTW